MARRINERNTGYWTLEGEPKTRRPKSKKVSRSFTVKEIEVFEYVLNQVNNDLNLDKSDFEDQYFRDSGNILINISRDDISEFRSLLEKFKK